MPYIMKQRSNYSNFCPYGIIGLSNLLDFTFYNFREAAGDVENTYGVSEPSVGGPRIDKLRNPKLLYPTQSLEFWCIN